MDIVVAGHVDHGKSTIIGRLLADTHSLPESKLEQVKELCARTAKPFEYAFLLDALRDERAQGITIDAARVFFKTPAREYLIIDAPGHIEFLKNMITGAARADAALLVIDAAEGVQENSRRHGYMMSMLGVSHLAVLVNKMDLVGYDQAHFARIEAEYRGFLDRVGVRPAAFIPVAGRDGDNIATRSSRLPWYKGATVLDTLDAFPATAAVAHLPFRMPVQDVYKFTSQGDTRRIVSGTVESGSAAAGDEVVFYPSGKRSVIKSFESFGQPAPTTVAAGQAIGFTLQEQIYVARGEVATMSSERRPELSSRLRVSLFWLGRNPLVMQKDYVLRIGTARAIVRLEALHKVIDASNLSAVGEALKVERHEVAECTLACNRAIAFDADGVASATSRFVIVDAYEICGGGIIREALTDPQDSARERVLLREDKWEPSVITAERRAERFGQRATLLIITGPRETDRKKLAKQLESRLFTEGHATYFLGMGNVLYGIGSDIARDFENRQEHVRRLAEIANLMLDAGMILIASAQELSADELGLIKTTVNPDRIVTVWMGNRAASDVACDLSLSEDDSDDENVQRVRAMLVERGVLENDLGSRFPVLGENDSRGHRSLSATVLWFTGLSGSGKSALARWVAEEWRKRGLPVEVLDGDAIRDVFPNTGFSKAERDAHVRRVGFLASRLESHGVTVVASLVSPYKESRDFVRGLCRNFIEIHVSTPLDECERRDAKGLYAKARRGEIRNFTGIDDPYEPPETPEIVIDTSRISPEAAGQLLLDVLGARIGQGPGEASKGGR